MINLTKHIITSIFFLVFFSSAYSQTFGGNKSDQGISFCELNGSYYMCGITRSFGAGSDDIWRLRVNEYLKMMNHNTIGNWKHHDIPSKIIKTEDDHIIIVGNSWDAPGPGYRNDLILYKYDSVGNNIWSSYFGGTSDDYSSGLIETKDNGILVTGINRAEGKEGAAFLMKVDENGVKKWINYYNTSHKDMGMDVVECPDSTLLLLVNSNTFTGKSAVSSEYLSSEATKIMIIKTDKKGNELWRKFYGDINFDFGKEIITNGKDYYFIGSSMNNSNGSFDIVLYKINEKGDVLFTQNYGGKGYEYGNSIDINDKGEMLLGGYSNSFSSNSDPDFYLVKVDSIGDVIWEETYGGSNSDYGEQALFLSGGNDEIGFIGTSTLIKKNKKVTDLFFIKIDSDGTELNGIVPNSNQYTSDYNNSFNVVVYPNPARDKFFIKTSDTISDDNIFRLFDMSGKLLHTEQILVNPFLFKLGTKLSAGVYLYQLEVKGGIKSGRIILNN